MNRIVILFVCVLIAGVSVWGLLIPVTPSATVSDVWLIKGIMSVMFMVSLGILTLPLLKRRLGE